MVAAARTGRRRVPVISVVPMVLPFEFVGLTSVSVLSGAASAGQDDASAGQGDHAEPADGPGQDPADAAGVLGLGRLHVRLGVLVLLLIGSRRRLLAVLGSARLGRGRLGFVGLLRLVRGLSALLCLVREVRGLGVVLTVGVFRLVRVLAVGVVLPLGAFLALRMSAERDGKA